MMRARQRGKPTPPMPIRLILTDDHPVVRAGYRRLLSADPAIEVVAEFGNGPDTVAWLDGHDADALLLDISMPGESGLQTLTRIAARWPALCVLVLSMHDGDEVARQAMAAGAHAYLSKASDPDALRDTLKRVLAGERVFPRHLVARAVDAPPGPAHASFTAREFDVFLALSRGQSVKEVADALALSAKTVYNYQTQIYRKLGVSNAARLSQYAARHGLLGPGR